MKERDRVCCYITRSNSLLIYEYAERYTPGCRGTMIVGGGVESGETLESAAIRETYEETGLKILDAKFLGSHSLITHNPDVGELLQHRHYFWLKADNHTPDKWHHQVSSGSADKGMIYKLKFVPTQHVRLSWEFDAKLAALIEKMGQESTFGV